jgi:CobQ/CobB/MinD/ParA nucleotide binding domain
MLSDASKSNVPPPAAESEQGRVVTFYSFKGGVGRSMALANIAYLLARDHHLDVIAVDWDLEAPGLHRYFNFSDKELGDGIIDYLGKYKKLLREPKSGIKPEDLLIEPYLRLVERFEGGGSLRLLSAGSMPTKSAYVEKVSSFDWNSFYADWNGAQVIEGLRKEFKEIAQVTLIDSRTGFTDVGGVCTVQLPDTVVFVFVFNEQNFAGVEQIAQELSDDTNPVLKALQRKPELLFLPSRKELTEVTRLRNWESEAVNRFSRFCDTPRIRQDYGNVATYLRKASVPYVPYFAYGEELAARTDKGLELAESFMPLIQLMVGREATKQAAQAAAAESKSPRSAWRNWLETAGAVILGLAILGAALWGVSKVYSWLYAQIAGTWGRIGLGIMFGAIGGYAGLFVRLSALPREERANEIRPPRLFVTIAVALIAGGSLGFAAARLFSDSRYYLVASVVAGIGAVFVMQALGRVLAPSASTEASRRRPL